MGDGQSAGCTGFILCAMGREGRLTHAVGYPFSVHTDKGTYLSILIPFIPQSHPL